MIPTSTNAAEKPNEETQPCAKRKPLTQDERLTALEARVADQAFTITFQQMAMCAMHAAIQALQLQAESSKPPKHSNVDAAVFGQRTH